MSHQRVVALLKACGKDFDASVCKWPDLLQMQCKHLVQQQGLKQHPFGVVSKNHNPSFERHN